MFTSKKKNQEQKTDGVETVEEYNSRIGKLIRYIYRVGGDEFSCVADTVEQAREKRDRWLKGR